MPEPQDFRWSGFYYPDIYAALTSLKTRAWPEHTEDNPHDPVNCILSAMAHGFHGLSCRLDHAAREHFLPTLRLRSSLIALGRLVDYELSTATPAEADLVADVSGRLTTTTTLIRAHALFATEDGIVFEYVSDDDYEAGATGAWESVLYDDSGTSYTTMAFPQALGTPTGGGPSASGDAAYFGHADLMFDKIGVGVSGGTSAITTLRWEYYDDYRTGTPDLTVVLGGGLRFLIDSVIGDTAADGLEVTVTCLRTGVSETCVVEYDAGAPGGPQNKIETTTFLGQTSASGSSADYEIQADWVELPDLEDGTAAFSTTGDVTWTLPQDSERRWAKTTVNGVEAYWIRARVVETSGAAGSLSELTEPRKTTWSCSVEVTQGQRVEDRLGTTDADESAGQTFTLSRSPYMSLVDLTVDGESWSEVDNFLSSVSSDKHFALDEQVDESWQVKFGDGTSGRIPSPSVPVVATYRVGGAEDGNVGALQIARDRSGNARVKNIRNPRAATGWSEQEGKSAAGLATARAAVPASLRTLGRAVTPEDAETLAVGFRTAAGAQVAVRAQAIEEGNGPKTVQLVCVGPGGVAPATADLEELDTYYNGTTYGMQRVGGVGLANTSIDPEAYTPLSVDVTVTVTVLSAYSTGAEGAVKAALSSLLSPTAKRFILSQEGLVETDVYLWDWGGEVSRAVLTAAIIAAVPGISNITLTTPAADVPLGDTELPVAGTISVTVVVA